MQRLSLIVLLVMLELLSACGQTGPLYLPEQKPATEKK